MQMPEFSGPSLAIKPPFYFKNMTACIFPLRAQLDSLQRFCDDYLNIIPKELGHFHASVPYVYLMMLDYGKLAMQACNLGWFAQREVMFCVFVEWYKVVDGRWVFHDWATVAPFIYVDDALSMTLGRTVLGWPKSLVKMTPQLTGWMQDPGGPTTDAAMSAMVFPKAYAGEKMQERVFMEVRSPMLSGLQVPPKTDSPLMPWTMFSNVMKSASGYAMDYLGLLKGMGLMPMHEGTSMENFARMATKAFEMGFPAAPNLSANTLNLKQFRRADKPQEYCFQALTNGPMRFTAFNRGALLGEMAILAGDPSGGYAVDLVRWPSFPIIETLGLHAEDGGFIEGVDGAYVARLKPVMPFWYDVDMEYDQGVCIAWRTTEDAGHWRDAAGELYDSETPEAHTEGRKRFNTTMGAGIQVLTGPFQFPSVTLRVLPLLARIGSKDTGGLAKLLQDSLNEPLAETGERFEVWGDPLSENGFASERLAYVYLIITDWGPVSSATNDIGDWANMGATFYIPVKRFRKKKGKDKEEFVGVGLFPALTFADGTTQAATFSELYGVDTIEASFVIPEGPWASGDDASAQPAQSLLRVDAEILPSMGEGQQTRRCPVLEVRDGGGRAVAEDTELSDRAEAFCLLLRREMERKQRIDNDIKAKGRLLALELLTGEQPFNVYTLKQFRDSGRPGLACYQALIRIPYQIQEVDQIEELLRLLRVEIHEYPSLRIVDDLGLVAREVMAGQGASVYTLEATRPFAIKAALSLDNGQRLWHRTTETWVAEASSESAEQKPMKWLDPLLEERISKSSPCYLKRTMRAWLDSKGSDERQYKDSMRPRKKESEEPISAEMAHESLKRVEPQSVIESILSREWEDRSSTSKRASLRQALMIGVESEAGAWGGGAGLLTKKLDILLGMGWRADEQSSSESKLPLMLAVGVFTRLEVVFAGILGAEEAKPSNEAKASRRGKVSEKADALPPDKGIDEVLREWQAVTNLQHEKGNGDVEKITERMVILSERFPHNPYLPSVKESLELQRDFRSCKSYKRADLDDPKKRQKLSKVVEGLLKFLNWRAPAIVDEALDDLIQKQRKPDHCVLRSTAGRERDRLFPLKYSWGRTWYRGPEPEEVPGNGEGT